MPHLPKSANIIQNHESLPGFIRIWWLDWLDIDWEWLTCFFCHFPCYPSQTMESRVRACLRMISWKMLICNRWYCSLKHDRYLLACFSSQYGAWDDSCNFFEWYLSSPFEFSEVLSVVHQKSNLFSRGPKFSWLVVSHILEFSPRFGEMIQYDFCIFQMGWNHQLVFLKSAVQSLVFPPLWTYLGKRLFLAPMIFRKLGTLQFWNIFRRKELIVRRTIPLKLCVCVCVFFFVKISSAMETQQTWR